MPRCSDWGLRCLPKDEDAAALGNACLPGNEWFVESTEGYVVEGEHRHFEGLRVFAVVKQQSFKSVGIAFGAREERSGVNKVSHFALF